MRVWTMLKTWLRTVTECRGFPAPPAHILTYDQIVKYWLRMDPKWQKECIITVLRIRRQVKGDRKPHIWRPIDLVRTIEAMPTQNDIRRVLGYVGTPDPYTIRIDREWEVSPGMKKKEEICIANFEL
jgi:hypothetical protein